jgi:formylglycine-generating enzyme required for sulfatase activity
MHDIFLSYSTKDRERLKPLFQALERQGWSVFWDHQSIHTGDNWHLKIDEAINNSRCVLVVWSKDSVQSEWVLEEAHKGKRRGVLLPIRIDAIEPPFGFAMRQAGDFTHWNGKPDHAVFIELAARIYNLLGNPPERPSLPLPAKSGFGLVLAGITAAAVAGGGAVWYAQSHGAMPSMPKTEETRTIPPITVEPAAKPPLVSPPVAEKPKRYQLTVNTTPDNATITVDGDAYDSANEWKPGTYTVKATADGYQPVEKTIAIEDQNAQVSLELVKLKPARLPFEPEMADIPAGSFTMGCDPKRDDVEGGCFDDEKPAHKVTLNAFKMGKYEVTVAQFHQFVEETDYKTTAETEGSCYSLDEKGSWSYVKGNSWRKLGFDQTDNDPVACVSWNDTQKYLEWLNGKIKPDKPYRLPTEAEWEYAARGGTDSAYFWGNAIGKGNANCANSSCGDKFDYTAPVGSFAANVYGLHDMNGNVWEWVLDTWHDDYKGAPADGSAWESGGSADRVLRGGSWGSSARGVRSALRYDHAPGYRFIDFGFRLASGQ